MVFGYRTAAKDEEESCDCRNALYSGLFVFPLSQKEILKVHLCVCVGYVLAEKEIEASFP